LQTVINNNTASISETKLYWMTLVWVI